MCLLLGDLYRTGTLPFFYLGTFFLEVLPLLHGQGKALQGLGSYLFKIRHLCLESHLEITGARRQLREAGPGGLLCQPWVSTDKKA